jgi:hypothetical protein
MNLYIINGGLTMNMLHHPTKPIRRSPMGRHYKIDGFQFPSVTTIISDCTEKPALVQWSANMVCEFIRQNCYSAPENAFYSVGEEDLDRARFNFRDVSKTALNIGSAVHQSIEDYLMTGKDPERTKEDDRILAGFVAFLEWMEEHHVEVMGVEEMVIGNCWAGTRDLKAKIDGVISVVDFKTSKAIYASEMGPQIAAYRSPDADVEASWILRLDKETGVPEFKDFSKRYEQDLNVFNRMVELFFARHPRIRKKAGYKEV